MGHPLVTIGIVSCNRFHYLRALIESARECIRYEPIQWILVDNASIEPRLREYIQGLDFVQHKVFMPARRPSSEHLTAMNRILALSQGDHVMILSDDVQFLVRGRWLEDLVELVESVPRVGTVTFNAQRRLTIQRYFGLRRWWSYPRCHPRRRRHVTHSGLEFWSYGRSRPGISGAGTLSFARKRLWEQLGPWKAVGRQTVVDSTGGGETEMLRRYAHSGLKLERYLTTMPVCASIMTDPIGSMARIRGNRRYGRYFAPPEGRFYYRIWEEAEARRLRAGRKVVAFEDIVVPLGYALPCDAQGNALKNPHQRDDDPFEWIHPSVAGQDILESVPSHP